MHCLPHADQDRRASMPQQMLTKTFVERAVPQHGQRTIYWDKRLPGFGLAVTPAGKRSWVIQYRHAGLSHRMTLDRTLTLDKARRLASKHLANIYEHDPL